MSRVLVVDGMNFMHRARAGFSLGAHAVTYNFFRNLRALVEKIDPQNLVFVLEGHPRDRLVEFPEYKANREEIVNVDDPKSVKKAVELEHFYRQAAEAIDLMRVAMPIQVIQHPHYECDDLIYTLCHKFSLGQKDEIVVASNDTDFIQLLNEFDNVKLYNPHLKLFVEKPEYDYVTWKSLRGDLTDNIGKLAGVGDVTAAKAMTDSALMSELLERQGNREIFERNLRLIKLKEIPKDELDELLVSLPKREWIEVVASFKDWGFKSIFKDKTWEKFKSTFDRLE